MMPATFLKNQQKKREATALRDAMRELNLKTGSIVTFYQEEILNVVEGEMHNIPALQIIITFGK
jgi:hypothetical protein